MTETKLLSLLFGDQLRRRPGKKVIPAEELGTLLDAQEMLQKLVQDADKYRAEVAVEGEQIKDEAQLAGFQKGLEGWTDQIALLEEHGRQIREELKSQILPVILQSAKKLVGRELQQDPETISYVVLNQLRAVSQHRKVTIYCNARDLEALEAHKDRLKAAFEQLETLSIRPREDIASGGCIIETEAGIINAQLEQLWTSLERVLRAYLEQHPIA